MNKKAKAISRPGWRVFALALFGLVVCDAQGQMAPSITTPPASQTSAQGGAVLFSVTATGTDPLYYQWRKDGTDLAGANDSNLILNSVTPADGGGYAVLVTNDFGSVTSSIAILTVVVPPVILQQPQPQIANLTVGASKTFTVLASGTAPLSYQWSKNGQAVSGATLNAYTLGNAQTSDSGTYSVRVSNGAGEASSSNAVLNVGIAPFITTQPQPVTAPVGGSASFSVTATGTPLNYQWLKNGSAIAGATTSALTLTNLASADGAGYSVVVSNFLGVSTSSSALLTVTTPPVITAQPQSQTVAVGATVTFNVAATGATSYQWRKDGLFVSSASSYTIFGVATNQAGNYTVVVSGSTGGSVTSSVAVLTVIAPPVFTLHPRSYNTNVGATLSFTSAVNGTTPLSYQWRKNGVDLPGATLNSLTLGNVQTSDSATYALFVSNPAGSATSSNVVLNVGLAPAITTQPQAVTAPVGGTASFSVAATGTPLNYQWYKNGIALAGATTSVLLFTNIVSTNAASYWVVVSNFLQSVQSFSVPLTVTTPPVITAQPQSQTVGVGGTVTFTVTATGAISYLWRKDGLTVFQSSISSYTISNVTTNNAGSYTVLVQGSSGTSVTSGVAVLTVIAPPVFGLQPKGTNTSVGTSVNLIATVNGTQPLSYQWRKNGVDISGETLSSLSLGNLQASDSGAYSIYVSNPAGSATSSNAVLNVGIIPNITAQPTSLLVTQGQSASFTIGATGTPLIYYWRKNGITIQGATNASYVIPSTLGSDAGSYSVLVSNFLGSRLSSSAALTVLVPVSITVQPTGRIAGEGSNTTFSVTATGTSPGFQWYKSGTAITGATGSSFSINNVQFGDGADYTVVVANVLNVVTSQVATLIVRRFPPAITDQPVSQSIPVGSNATFAVGATGTTLVYQWQKEGTNLLNGTDAALLLTNVGFADAGGYSLIITNPVGSVTSIVAALTVGFPPAIVQQPASLIIPVGSNAVFIVDVSGTEPLSYQWNKNDFLLLNQTNKVLQLNTVTANDTAGYTLFAYSPFGAVTSAVATLTVQLPPQILQPPVGGFVAVGSNFTFSVTATGWEPLSYRWQKDGLAVSSATATNYSRTNLTLGDAGAYAVVVTNFLGSVTSSIATLAVGYPPVVGTPPQSSTNLLGRTVVLSCTVTGTPPINLQWLFNGGPLLNQTNATLTITNLQYPTAGYYALSAANAFGGVVSANAQIWIFGTGPAVWSTTGTLTSSRQYHTATLLANGKVLVAGGVNFSYLSSAELYDQASGTWTATGTMTAIRYAHTATLLPNGKVLVVGGYNGAAVSGAELFDPATETWTATGALTVGRGYHTATLLPNGKVLVAGGDNGGRLSSAELFDPATGTWTTTGALNTARVLHTATLLSNGKVLVAGGLEGSYLSSAELFDPATGTWTTTGAMNSPRENHTATLLPNGKVLVAGGDNTVTLSGTELYDPDAGLWTTSGVMTTPRANHTASLLADGAVLVAGGQQSGSALSSSDLYDPGSGTWTATSVLNTARYGHTATLLPNGLVLAAGGYGTNGYLSSSELYRAGQPSPTLTLGNLAQTYDGTAKSVSVTTTPPGLLVDVTYNGSAGAPTNAGTYTVIGAINDPYYQGSATNTLVIYPAASTLTGAAVLPNGAFRFSFANSPGALFEVMATTNLGPPPSAWVVLGVATEVSPGQFQFTDPEAPNNPRRFYRVRSP